MISISISSVKKAFSIYKIKLDKFNSEVNSELFALSQDTSLSHAEKKYVGFLIQHANQLITCSKSDMKRFSIDFNSAIPHTVMESATMKPFRRKVLKALGYSKRRTDFYPNYFKSIGIKACVYCNSQLTVAIDSFSKGNPRAKAKFQVDHVLPKSQYPCFSVSLFNLVPSCASCNNCKGSDTLDFSLYEKTVKYPSKYKFRLDPASELDYIITRDCDKIILSFIEPNPSKGNKTFKKTFDIEGIYNTQKDLVEELILKAEIYSPSYKANLIRDFREIFTDSNLTNRLIIGNYSDEKDIHKRPMAKLVQDIARQLGLI